MKNLLAFDFGASSGRAILGCLDDGRLTIEEIHRFPNEPIKFAGHLQWDILRLCREMKQGILKCAQRAAAGGCGLASVAVDTWGVDFGLLDNRGELIENPYHYRDERTNGMVEKCLEVIGKEELYGRTGIGFTQYNTIYQLLAMKCSENPALPMAETILLMPDLLHYFLTGVRCAEYTEATTSQLYSHVSGDWDFETIGKLGLPNDIFPAIRRPGESIGLLKEELADELGVARIPVTAAASHDTASAVAAIPAGDENFIYICTGTWIMVGTEHPVPILTEQAMRNNFTNEGGYGGTITFQKNMMGTWILQECKRQWEREGAFKAPLSRTLDAGRADHMERYSYESMIQAAKTTSAASWIDPDHAMFFPPGDMPQRILQFCDNTGQPRPKGIGAVIRCIEESLALKCRYNTELIESITGRKANCVYMLGGGIQDELLCQLVADATQKKVIAGLVEATAVGNILVQGIAVGEIKNISEARGIARDSFKRRVYVPNDDRSIKAKYQAFLRLL